MSITIYTPNNEVVAPTDVNTQAGTVREDIPTHDEELALLVYEEDFRQAELAKFLASAKRREGEIWEEEEFRALDRAFNNALSQGFVIDESTECYTDGCNCSRSHA